VRESETVFLLFVKASSEQKELVIVDDGWHEIFHDAPVRRRVLAWLDKMF
jgi:alpha-beta hydrolase superfamily lysophospholipase